MFKLNTIKRITRQDVRARFKRKKKKINPLNWEDQLHLKNIQFKIDKRFYAKSRT